ncbi:uncharacterized protein A1O9_10233 [Exophiala aquamarina CBS 119918]|uniref:Uncharacterized protein n=1 Tax=Exophiala aquamarina CBS 119918 TaxID=1182545 RepID=A0A072P1Y5_9EURO|nr:uncharacterized protein A1O9_10233 [Exophiala aquamarina CBS 119918]KEF53831.1 hypothetical protein A1O9_10233 [Exophiala aquamarina CBS 119918]
MQRSWRLDGDKLTFIVCKRAETSSSSTSSSTSGNGGEEKRDGALDLATMIGDVNLFVSRVEWAGNDEEAGTRSSGEATVGELELMIAVQAEQRNGYGKAALLAFLEYIVSHEDEILRECFDGTRGDCNGDGNGDGDSGAVTASTATTATATATVGTRTIRRFDYLTVKIGEANIPSIGLFEGLQFHKTKDTPNYFGEFELKLVTDGLESLRSSVAFDPASGLTAGIAYRELEYCCPS